MSEFDEKAATWDDDPIRVARAQVIAGVLAKNIELTKVGKAMEYGSGTGLLSFSLKDLLSNVTLMDESKNMTEVALNKCKKNRLSGFKPVQYDLVSSPLPAYRLDLIYTMLTLHHVLPYRTLIGKFSQLLNQNGSLVIIDLVEEDGSFHEGEFNGHNGFKRKELEEVMMKHGLTPQSYEICYTLERETESGIRQYPLFMLIAKKA